MPTNHLLLLIILGLMPATTAAQNIPFVWQVNLGACAPSEPSRTLDMAGVPGGGVVAASYCVNQREAKAHRILATGQASWSYAFCTECDEFESDPTLRMHAKVVALANNDIAIIHSAAVENATRATRLTNSGNLRHNTTILSADPSYTLLGYAHPSGTLLTVTDDAIRHLGGTGNVMGMEFLTFDPIISADYFYFEDLTVGADGILRRALRIEEGAISFGFPPRFVLNRMNINLTETGDPALSMNTFDGSMARIHADGSLVEFGNNTSAGGNFRIRRQAASGSILYTTGHVLPDSFPILAELNGSGELAVVNSGFSQHTIARFDGQGRLIHYARVPFSIDSLEHAANGEVGVIGGPSNDRVAIVYRSNGGVRHFYRCKATDGCTEEPEVLAANGGLWFVGGKRNFGNSNRGAWVAQLDTEVPSFASGFEP